MSTALQIVKLNRRHLLGAALAGGGLALAARVTSSAAATPPATGAGTTLNAYVEITPDDQVFIYTPAAEMGQGVADSLPKIVAEEMDADWTRVKTRLSGADARFVSPVSKLQRTSSSDSVSSYYAALRQVGASARLMLLGAAAARWAVPVTECTVADGVITHTPSKKTLRFGDVAAAAAKLTPPQAPTLKDPSQFKLIGKSLPRKDLPAKVNGSAVFGADVVLPNMAYAAIRHCPVAGGRITGFDRAALMAAPGVLAVVDLDGKALAVVGKTFWHARTALDAAELKTEGGATGLSTASLHNALVAALKQDDKAIVYRNAKQPEAAQMRAAFETALKAGAKQFDAEFEVPYLAHATMEPVCATAMVTADKCTIWAPLQAADTPRQGVADLLKLPLDKVELNRTFIGGGFGRKWEFDFVVEAVKIAQTMPGRPVKLIWSREEDVRHDHYRPGYRVRTRAAIGADGKVAAIHSRIAGQSVFAYQKMPLPPGAPDFLAVIALIADSYDVPQKLVDYVPIEAPLGVGFWRGVMNSQNDFFSEVVIDELATLAGKDPVVFRQSMLGKAPRVSAVLKACADRAGWGKPLAAGVGRGVSCGFDKGSAWAQVAEVEVKAGKLKVTRITCAFDCGFRIDPRNIESQIEGGILFGLSAVLAGEINFENGAAVEGNFDAYRLVKFADTPPIEVILVDSDNPPGGVGELGTLGIAAAVTNAVFSATKKRVRTLPLSKTLQVMDA